MSLGNFTQSLVDVPCAEEGQWEFKGTAPTTLELPFLAGHFPHYPVIPGFVTIATTASCLERIIGREKSLLLEVVSAKFVSPLIPGDAFQIKIQPNQVAGLWSSQWINPETESMIATLLLRLQID